MKPHDYGACRHLHTLIDDQLNEIECADCGAKLNPMWVLKRFASQLSQWEFEHERIRAARKQLEERARCRCTKCGVWTEIRRVSDREVEHIRAGRPPPGPGGPRIFR